MDDDDGDDDGMYNRYKSRRLVKNHTLFHESTSHKNIDYYTPVQHTLNSADYYRTVNYYIFEFNRNKFRNKTVQLAGHILLRQNIIRLAGH